MRRYGVVCALWVLLWQTAAFAQTQPPQNARERASAHFQRGVELYEDGAYRAALVEFRRAYEVAPNYRLLYNIGQTQLELQDFLGATQSYEDFLHQGGSQVPEAQRQSLEDALRALRTRVGRIALTVDKDGAEVFIDETLVGRSPIVATIPVNVGLHRLAARSEDGATGSATVEVAGGEIAQVSIEMSAPTPVAAAQERGMPLSTKLAIAGWGGGGALLLGSLITGVMALSADNDFDELLSKPNVDPKKEAEERDRLKTLALTTDILFATGAVVALAGTAMWMLGRREHRKEEEAREKSARLHVDFGLASMSLRGQF